MENRKWFIVGGFALLFGLYGLLLLDLQVFNNDYKTQAEANIVQRIVEQPLRGMIYDREGKLIVSNTPVFNIMVVPNRLNLTEEDTVELCEILELDRAIFRKRMKTARNHSKFQPSVLMKQVRKERYAEIQDRIVKYPGLEVQTGTVREYPYRMLSHALGYVREVSRSFVERDQSGYYRSGDVKGARGIELSYEEELRGTRGVSYIMKNVHGVVKGSFRDGKFDTIPEVGKDLTTSIDLDLQLYAEELMKNKRGAVVAIEPKTGEILTMVSSPSYDPKEFNKAYDSLRKDLNKPLLDRAMQSRYPPGSTFKTVMAMIGLQNGVLDTLRTYHACAGEPVACHGHPSPLNIAGSIQHSCNPWYYKALRKIIPNGKTNYSRDELKEGLNNWKKQVEDFGFGHKLGVDLPSEKPGLVPGSDFYDKAYDNRPWKISNIYSISIGQGEVLAMPLQLANLATIIANRGWYYTPHIVKSIGEDGPREEYQEKHQVQVKSEYIDYIARAMAEVPRAGTAPRAYDPEVVICGKTGTAQNPHGKDHSIFIAFAPLNNPEIAIAVYVENAGFGGTWAAPIASLVIEKHLKDQINRTWLENYVLNGNLLAEEDE